MKEYEDVVVTDSRNSSGRDEKEYNHPAFGQVKISRRTGHKTLYGSDLTHHSYIAVSFHESTLYRGLSNDRYFSKLRPFAEVCMSEAQWATLVSSFNMADGVPCTIQSREGVSVPMIPPPVETTRDKFSADIKSTVDALQTRLRDIMAQLEGPLPKTKVEKLRKEVEVVSIHLASNLDFVVEQFDEHVETSVERAKIEVQAYTNNVIRQAGLTAIQQGTPIVELPESVESTNE